MNKAELRISVRNLVEFVYRTGDLQSGGLGTSKANLEAMQLGSKIHKKIQRQMGIGYEAEVPLFVFKKYKSNQGNPDFKLKVEGRADGILRDDEGVLVDEIKGVYDDLDAMEAPKPVHRAQAMCYAYMIATKENLDKVWVQITYCHLETEYIRRFKEHFTFAQIEKWFDELMAEYEKWAVYEYDWTILRNKTIDKLEFPFPYREGQRELAGYVYKTIEHNKKIFIQAPTGVGKTITTIFPSVKAMGEGLVDKIFYLTAKTITRTVASQCFDTLAGASERALKFKVVTITAKEKSCILEERPSCNPDTCPRAKGHFDRINEALYDILTHEDNLDRETIYSYADKHEVCPFELTLDATLYADAVIMDYNYAFDPNVSLRRFFSEGKKDSYAFLVDEAHNLVPRAREMYSAVLIKEDFLEVRKIMKEESKMPHSREAIFGIKNFISALTSANSQLHKLKTECDGFQPLTSAQALNLSLLRLINAYEIMVKELTELPARDMILDFYFSVRHFVNMYEDYDDKSRMYTKFTEAGKFMIKLQCMDPSDKLADALAYARGCAFFSATLLPMNYYMEQLSICDDDYAVYAKSSFKTEQRQILIANNVTSKYTRRGVSEYRRIADYIEKFVSSKTGNYMIFFPSYSFMDSVINEIDYSKLGDARVLIQEGHMSEDMREEFLQSFDETNEDKTLVGFCVMGGIFSEGIDLKEDRLIGTAIVGTGLPMVSDERNYFKEYFASKGKNGFDYAYLYPGINKVFQAGGRVIRTINDRGVILLLDERFLGNEYTSLFPKEWFPFEVVTEKNISKKIKDFWNS
ncbi:MAG: ATP-dependent DNA helicase [Eubacterium sp.]|nr:ATP-dependent DNA helicase [Eubacterium sp.]